MKVRRPPSLMTRGRLAPKEELVTVRCAYCEGTGKDPWGILSFLSNCVVCSGRGVVRLRGPVKECAFCNGTGIQPYTANRLHCMACGGKGVVTKIDPSMECPTCKGSGINPRIVDPPLVHCSTCRGQGVVLQKE